MILSEIFNKIKIKRRKEVGNILSLIKLFQNATRVHTKSEFVLFLIVLFLFFVILWIVRCPSYDEAGLWVYGAKPKEIIANTLADIFCSFLLATVFFIIF